MSFQEKTNVIDPENVEQSAMVKLTKDLRNAAATLNKEEVRFLVDYYYQLQNDRIRAQNRLRAFSEGREPHEVIVWLSDNTAFLEQQIKKALLAYAESDPVGKWMLSVPGIGGTLAAGLLAHIDIEKSPSVGHIYSFAGIAPNAKKWEKGGKRPFNAKLKTLTWKIGESFVKVSSNQKDFYGKVYRENKDLLIASNEKGEYADDAARILQDKKFGKETEAYAWYAGCLTAEDAIKLRGAAPGALKKLRGEPGSGIAMLPPAHVHARAKRKAIYLFLSHMWEVMYRYQYPERTVPRPYAIEHGGHVHYIPVFNDPFTTA